jgi:hypothetical protein
VGIRLVAGEWVPVGAEAMNEHSRSLVRYIREIDIIILGIGILLFVTGDNSHFSKKLFIEHQFRPMDVILFISVYIFLTYDWIAYSTLISKYEYNIDGNNISIIRLYIDLLQLFVKALLVYLTTLEITMWHLLLASGLFAIWHFVVLLWHWRVTKEYAGVPPMRLSHVLYLMLYIIYAGITFYFGSGFENSGPVRYLWTGILCLIVIVTSLYRQRRFLEMASAGAGRAPASVDDFDAQIMRLRAVVEANVAAHGRIKELDELVKKTQTTVAELERKLSP